MPEAALAGTFQVADTAQLPQSTRPVDGSLRQAGCACGKAADGSSVATLRAPAPP